MKRLALAAFVVVMPWWAPIPHALADQIEEDQLGWSCVDDGNRICGPGNDEGKPAGCYDDGGVLVAPWPCHVEVNADGSADVFVP